MPKVSDQIGTWPPGGGLAAYFAAPIADFLASDPASVLGHMTAATQFPLEQTTITAWQQEIAVLQRVLVGLPGHLFLEFDVPRLGSRIDAVVISGSAILPLEFKVGATSYLGADYDQAWDYALDLKNFHRASHAADIFPILIATEATSTDRGWRAPHADGVRPPFRTNSRSLQDAIRTALVLSAGVQVDGLEWSYSPYQPTPTIVEAARALYARHSVAAISRNDAGAKNLTITSSEVERIIQATQAGRRKAIVFVTGVPGAGKTLVGLNIATQHRRAVADDPAHAVFLSGNGPLVKVLGEALTRDEYARLRAAGTPVRKGAVAQRVKPFIQNVHHFRDAGLRNPDEPPADHVVIFDEAQRAWNRTKTASFMQSRKGIADFARSEPEFQLEYMDRRTDWAVAICLVGGGQEIHDGEGGIEPALPAQCLVLLTRARQGMALFVPPGDPGDCTRLPEFYDETFAYLTDLGIAQI